jgi:hypothetical protein
LIDLRQIAQEQCQVKAEVTTSGVQRDVTWLSWQIFCCVLCRNVKSVCVVFRVQLDLEDIVIRYAASC